MATTGSGGGVPLLGCVADDFTGATDLANTLVKNGMTTVQLLGVPDAATAVPEADAVVVALKSRTIAVADAVAQSVAALDWLRAAGAGQFFFKYCSTFDSTEKGNIGPVAEALMARLGTRFTIACPAFPENGRTLYKGHLFVGDLLLSDSSMRHHPLTPMTDANLVRFLGRQTQGKVGLVPFPIVEAGAKAVKCTFRMLEDEGTRIAIVDAVTDRDLAAIGEACAGMALVTGGSGVALGLPENFRRRGLLTGDRVADALPAVTGPEAVISGSCSPATLAQVARFAEDGPVFPVDPLALAEGRDLVGEALDWARGRLGQGPLLVSASAPAATVAEVQKRLGVMAAGELVERALAGIARGLVAAGVRRLVVAGGETAGAVVGALGIRGLRIGREIAPGVPCTVSLGETPMALALKSGNFGDADFFTKAFRTMP
ncbi:3-oxo-tetronate kinase [Shumkonia mesophila]|uniref:3-oxo-tetronate kinase n=1 Tax=Shumkonia mesophila TaxID=2838854 RepID=UPI0029350C1E|nr:3-oxo-tetronate kinase [Shumkonia mesophila]